jgi:hypothetical protein
VEEFHELGVLGRTLADLRTKTLVRAGMEVNARAKPRWRWRQGVPRESIGLVGDTPLRSVGSTA